MTGATELTPSAGANDGRPPVTGVTGVVGPDRRLVLFWTVDPAYREYEIHESTVNPAHSLQAVRTLPPRTSAELEVRPTPLRYGVRGRTADGTCGPFSDAVEVLVTAAGGTVTGTDERFVLPASVALASAVPWLTHADGTPVRLATGGGGAAETTAATVAEIPLSGVVRYTGPPLSSTVTLHDRIDLTLTFPDGALAAGATLELAGVTRNVRLRVSAPYENADGRPIVLVRGAYDTVTVIDSVFGPATPATPPATTPSAPSSFVTFGDDGSAGSTHGAVVLSTLRNKTGPGAAVQAAGRTDDPAGAGGVRYTYLGLSWVYGMRSDDGPDLPSTLQRTDGQHLVEGNLFGGPDAGRHAGSAAVTMWMSHSVVRGNTFWNHTGSVALRHGDAGRIVDNNFRSDHQAGSRGAGGGRLYGRDHRFVHNTVWVRDGLPTGRFERPFLADSGDALPGSLSPGHAVVEDLVCADNLFFRCGDGGGPIFDGRNFPSARATGVVRGNLVVECPSPGPDGVTVVGTGSTRLRVTGTEIHRTAAAAGVVRDATGWPSHPAKGSRAPFLTPDMVGRGGRWRPPGWSDAGG